MRGYWHIYALAAAMSFLTILVDNYWFIAGFLLWLCYLYKKERLGKGHFVVSLAFFLFFLNYFPVLEDIKIPPPSENLQHQGKIISPVTTTPEKVEFIMQESNSETKTAVVYFPEEESPEAPAEFAYGASCIVQGEMELPPEARNPGQFDYREYLLTKGIAYQVVVDSIDAVTCEDSSFLQRIYTLRERLLSHVSGTFSQETAAWMRGLVLGDDSHISEETIELFQRWSLSHVLAISGLHIGLAVGFVYFLLIKLNLFTKEKAQWFLIFFLPVYTVVAGGEPSILRAASMVLLFILLNKLKVKMLPSDVISIVFLILILADSYMIYHVGFQLSFAVTFGLILSAKLLSETKQPFFQVLQIGFVAQLMILPLLFAYFSLFQPLSILLNWLVVPYFSGFVIPFMFVLLLFSPLPFLPGIMDTLFVRLNELVIDMIAWVDVNFSYPWIMGSLPLIFAVLYYVLLYFLMKYLQEGKPDMSFKYGIAITAVVIAVMLKPYFSPEGRVTMLDIGQGDSFVIELPYRSGVMLIDAGSKYSFTDMQPTENVYEQIIKPYLYSRGIREIDAVFITHEDIDHAGSLRFILEEMHVENLFISPHNQTTLKQIQKSEHDTTVQVIDQGDQLTIGSHRFEVLAPEEDQRSANENSLVLHSQIGGKDWLFTGDIGSSQERVLIQKYPNLPVDVLKVAHHGSNTSTDPSFLEHISPEFALIPVGVENQFGHPAPDVVEAIEKEGAVILRTDIDGAVQYKFIGSEGTFYRYLP